MDRNSIATQEDIQQLKAELAELLVGAIKQSNVSKKWLKSNEVMEMLGLSASGLQNLRINGTIPHTKLGGIIYYDHEEILRVLEKNKRGVKW